MLAMATKNSGIARPPASDVVIAAPVVEVGATVSACRQSTGGGTYGVVGFGFTNISK